MPAIAAATATDPAATGTLLLVGLVWAAGYVIACIIWPYRACTRCNGYGRFLSPTGRAWRYCHRCGGKGAQLRIGRRIYDYLRTLHGRDH